MTICQDQIWVKSQCREKELRIGRQLSRIARNDVQIKLVDSLVAQPGIVYVTDNIMPSEHEPLYPEFWGIYNYQPTYISRPPNRLFNCFINRVCPNRQSWFYQLIRRNLLSKGFVSYLVDSTRTEWHQFSSPVVVNDMIFYRFNQTFAVEHATIRLEVPYCNFDQDLDQCVVDSKVSLVLETYFDNPNISFSEKIFRAIQLPRPFLMYNWVGAVDVLRNHGFDVWHDVVDHSYDAIRHYRNREQAILDQLVRMDAINFTPADLLDFERRAQHNRSLLKSFEQRWPAKLKSIMEKFAK